MEIYRVRSAVPTPPKSEEWITRELAAMMRMMDETGETKARLLSKDEFIHYAKLNEPEVTQEQLNAVLERL